MLFVSLIEDFNGKEEILKASHTKKKIITLFLSEASIPSFPLKSSLKSSIKDTTRDTKSIG